MTLIHTHSKIRKKEIEGSSALACRWTKLLCAIGLFLFLMAILNTAWTQKTPDMGIVLGDKHKMAGIECLQCHKEKPSAPVPTEVCLSCHQNLNQSDKTKKNLPNPHDAHIPFPDCADCHHAHKPSVNQCDACHNFGYKIP